MQSKLMYIFSNVTANLFSETHMFISDRFSCFKVKFIYVSGPSPSRNNLRFKIIFWFYFITDCYIISARQKICFSISFNYSLYRHYVFVYNVNIIFNNSKIIKYTPLIFIAEIIPPESSLLLLSFFPSAQNNCNTTFSQSSTPKPIHIFR